jgi:hypothetical protein
MLRSPYVLEALRPVVTADRVAVNEIGLTAQELRGKAFGLRSQTIPRIIDRPAPVKVREHSKAGNAGKPYCLPVMIGAMRVSLSPILAASPFVFFASLREIY